MVHWSGQGSLAPDLGPLLALLAEGAPMTCPAVVADLAPTGVLVSFACFDAARKSFEALTAGAVDVAFLAIEPAREAEVSFTAAYVIIEGVYAVPDGSPITTASEVDRPGWRVGLKEGSAYDLFLSRTLTHAKVVRGSDGIDVFREQGLEVAAGIRQPLSRHVANRPGLRLVEPRFMQIRQAIATTKDRTDTAIAFLREFVETVKANGFVADALARSGQDAAVAPPCRHGSR